MTGELAALLDDLDALLVPYGADPNAFWRLCVDRPDMAEAALAAAGPAGVGDDPAVETLTKIVEGQRAAAAAGRAVVFKLVDRCGRVDVVVPGASPN